MSTLPLTTFWDTSKTEGEANTGWFQKMLAVTKELPGGAEATTELTIASGVITPTAAFHLVDTEADAATDDLSSIAVTNMPVGRRLLLKAAHTDRSIVLKHLAGGSGQISLTAGADITLDDDKKMVELVLEGTTWKQIDFITPKLTAAGSIPYATAFNTIGELLVGSVDMKLFTNAAGNGLEWAYGFKTINTSFSMTKTTGTISITGVGFKPRAFVLLAIIDTIPTFSVGIYASGGEYCIRQNYAGNSAYTASLSQLSTASGDYQTLALSTLDTDGVTITNTKNGSPTGTSYLTGLFWR